MAAVILLTLNSHFSDKILLRVWAWNNSWLVCQCVSLCPQAQAAHSREKNRDKWCELSKRDKHDYSFSCWNWIFTLNPLQNMYVKSQNRWNLLWIQVLLCQLMRFCSLWKAIKQWTLCSRPCQYSDSSPLSTQNYLIPISFCLFKCMQIKVAAN